jgi:hypothetical protein
MGDWLCRWLHRTLGWWLQDGNDFHGFPQRRECAQCGRLWFHGPWRDDRWECGGRGAGKTEGR